MHSGFQKPKISQLARLALLLVIAFVVGCNDYSTMSRTGYDYCTALYAICNRQDETRLTDISAKIATAREQGELNEQETEWLNDIINTATAGDWKDAAKSARVLLEAQVQKK